MDLHRRLRADYVLEVRLMHPAWLFLTIILCELALLAMAIYVP